MGLPYQSTAGGGAHFHTTSWTVVREAGGSGEESAIQRAREELCRSYWKPVVALLRARGLSRHDAEDVAQEYFQHILTGGRLARLNEDGARFRVWLRKGAENFMITEYRRRGAQKRGAHAEHIEINEHHVPMGHDSEEPGPQALEFDRVWASTVVEAALERLRERYVLEGQVRIFNLLSPQNRPGEAGESPGALAAELGMEPATARKAMERYRRRFREAIRARVALTVADPGEVEDEMRYLRRVLLDS
ncbi:MAG: sigma-70 family RNA polymerase sigma factor [Verrucomicrobia bacterium]|nr:sigma-70 family RNA polymerase sigma factor [Verrucomicrobiota bacterium]